MQMRNPHPPARSGLDGWTRLIIVAVGIAAAAWFLVPAYIDSAKEIRAQFRSIDARRQAGDDLSRYRVVRCSSDWLGRMKCDHDQGGE